MEKQKKEAVDNREYRYYFRLNAEENNRFLDLFEKSGAHTKTKFILGRLFDREFRVVQTDAEKHIYYTKLSDFYRQFRGLATNYNQVTKKIHKTFSDKQARYLLHELKEITAKLGDVLGKVLLNIEEVKQKW